MQNLLHDMKALNVQNKTVALIENGTWAATTGKQMSAQLEEMKNMTVIEQTLTVKSALKKEQGQELQQLADEIASSVKKYSI